MLKEKEGTGGKWEQLCLDSPATAEKLRLAIGDDLVKRTEVAKREGEKAFFVSVA